jgi:hypothetical protein
LRYGYSWAHEMICRNRNTISADNTFILFITQIYAEMDCKSRPPPGGGQVQKAMGTRGVLRQMEESSQSAGAATESSGNK